MVLDRLGGKTVLDVVGLGGSFIPAESDGGEVTEEAGRAV